MATLKNINVSGKQEDIAALAQRYIMLANPKNVEYLMRKFTTRMSSKLVRSLRSIGQHPRDTGTLQSHWFVNTNKLKNNHGPKWFVEAQNDATVEEQHIAKTGRGLYTSGRKRSKPGNPELLKNTKYLKFVPKAIQVYNERLRTLRQKIDSEFKEFIYHELSVNIANLPEGYRTIFQDKLSYDPEFKGVGWKEYEEVITYE